MIDQDYANKLGLKTEGNIKAQGVDKVVDLSFVELPSFSITGIIFEGQKVAAFNLHMLKKWGLDAVGILGYDFLSRFVTKIDYANRRISFYDPNKFEYKNSGTIIDAPLRENMFYVPMTVDDMFSGLWLVDIGASSISLNYL